MNPAVRVASCIAVTMFALSLPFSEALKWWSWGLAVACALVLKGRTEVSSDLVSRTELLGFGLTAVLVFSCLESVAPGMTLKAAWKTGSGIVVLWSFRALSAERPRVRDFFTWALLVGLSVGVLWAAFSDAGHGAASLSGWRLSLFSLGHPNGSGAVLVMAAVLSLALALKSGGSWTPRAAALCLGLLMVAGLLLTRSRGAWLGGLAILAYLVVFKIRGLRGKLLLAAAAIAAALLMPEAIQDRFLSILSLEDDHASFHPRLETWQWGFRQYLEYPITGYGLGSFQQRCDFESCPAPIRDLHSGYLQFLFEAGPFALLLLLAFLGSLLGGLWRGRTRSPFAEAAFMALVAVMVHGLVDATFRDEPFALAMALAGLGLSSGEDRRRGAPTSTSP